MFSLVVLAASLLVASALPVRAVGASVVTEHCAHSHEANDDPIVYPGQPGASHLHEFAGNPATDAFATPASLYARAQTTCRDQPSDFSGYWVPAVYMDGVQLRAEQESPYWGDNSLPVVAPPFGMEFVARGWGSNVFFACTIGSKMYNTPPDCTGRGSLKFRIEFPSCWDGVGTMPSSFAYPSKVGPKGTCPVGFPTRIVQLELQVGLPVVNGLGHVFTCAALPDMPNDYTTMHADFMSAFDPSAMQVIVDTLNA